MSPDRDQKPHQTEYTNNQMPDVGLSEFLATRNARGNVGDVLVTATGTILEVSHFLRLSMLSDSDGFQKRHRETAGTGRNHITLKRKIFSTWPT
jgi:hypothetical protein